MGVYEVAEFRLGDRKEGDIIIFASVEDMENAYKDIDNGKDIYIKKDGIDAAGFLLLADSLSCEVEAVKHKHDPFYGVQFHPERIEIKGQTNRAGHKILENFFTNVVKK